MNTKTYERKHWISRDASEIGLLYIFLIAKNSLARKVKVKTEKLKRTIIYIFPSSMLSIREDENKNPNDALMNKNNDEKILPTGKLKY